jgi:hypothetical protein
MGKGNKETDKSMMKTIFEDNIIIPLPKVLLEKRSHSMFSLVSPIQRLFNIFWDHQNLH